MNVRERMCVGEEEVQLEAGDRDVAGEGAGG